MNIRNNLTKNTPGQSYISTNRGTSLMEVIVGLAVFAFLAMIFASSVIMAARTSGINGQYAQATGLAQHKIDQLRAFGYGKLTYSELYYPPPSDSTDPNLSVIDVSPSTSPYSFKNIDNVTSFLGPDAEAKIYITPVASDPTRKLLIKVTITWKSNHSMAKKSEVTVYGYIVNVE